MEEKERKLKELEKEWTRKVDENDVDEEEDVRGRSRLDTNVI
jgi:hypothetical protein